MTTFLTDNKIYTSSIGVPEANDPLTAASVRGAFQGLLDRTAWLRSSASFHTPTRKASGYEQVWLRSNSTFGSWTSEGANVQTMLSVSGSSYIHANGIIGENSKGVHFASHVARTVMAGCKDAVWATDNNNAVRVSMWITPQTACTGTQLLFEKRYRPDQSLPSSGSVWQSGIAFDMTLDRLDPNVPGFNTVQVRVRTGTSGSTSMVHQVIDSTNLAQHVHGLVIPYQPNLVGFVYDGSNALLTYVNGVLQSTQTGLTGGIDWNTTGPTGYGPYAIGARASTNDPQAQTFAGYIHEVKVERGPYADFTDQYWIDNYLTGSRRYDWNVTP